MANTDISHVKDGVSVSWAHTCGHLSNPLFYASMENAENDRARMEGQWCWECRNSEAVKQAKGRR
jgi:hypothetical protein